VNQKEKKMVLTHFSVYLILEGFLLFIHLPLHFYHINIRVPFRYLQAEVTRMMFSLSSFFLSLWEKSFNDLYIIELYEKILLKKN